MKRLFSICLCICLLLSMDVSSYAQAVDDGISAEGQVSVKQGNDAIVTNNGVSGDAIIKFKDEEKGKKKLKDKKKKIKKSYKHVPVVVADQLTTEEWNEFKQDPNVEYIEPNGVVRASEEPLSAQAQPAEWSQIYAGSALQFGLDGSGIKVAVFDTGINSGSNDLTIKDGISFVPDEPTYDDLNGHGSAVASIIAAKKNDVGMTGIAPSVDLYAVKVLNQSGVGVYSQVIEAIDWAIDRKIDIVSMSFAGYQPSLALEEAMNLANANGILLVAPVGNEGTANVDYPAKYNSVIAVGAVNQANRLAYFSNTGIEVDLVAPGVDVNVLTLTDTVEARSGTSFAVPFVTAALALAKQKSVGSSAQLLRQAVLDSTTKFGSDNTASFGSGLLNIQQLLGGGEQQLPQTNFPSPVEVFKVLQTADKFSELKSEEQKLITSFYQVTNQLMLDCELRGMSLLDSVQAAPRINQFGISLDEFTTLHERIGELSKLDIILNENQTFLRNYAVTDNAKPIILELLIEGYKSVTIYFAYKVNQALDIPMTSLVLGQELLTENQLDNLGELSEAEEEAVRKIASVFIVNLSTLQSYKETAGITWVELEETLRKYLANQGGEGQQGSDQIKAAGAASIPEVKYDKYVQAPFSLNNGNESVEAGTGNLKYSFNNYTLSGKNGMDVQLGIYYDSSDAGLNDPDFYYSSSSYIDYDYEVSGRVEAYFSSPGVGTGRWYYYDEAPSVIGVYETFTEADNAAGTYARIETIPNKIGDGTDLIKMYIATVKAKYDPSDSWVSTTQRDELISNTYSELQSNIGSGWSLGFSSIESDSRGSKYLHLSRGEKYKINITSTVGDSNLEKYTLKNIRLEQDASYTNTQNIQSTYVLVYEGGIKEYFGDDGRLLARKDRFGNTISFEHQVINGRPVISKITDTLKRVFQFTYTTDSASKKLVITLPSGKTIEYISKLIPGYSNEYVLEQVKDQGGRITKFQYDTATCIANFSFFSKTDRGKQNNYACLKSIKYPTDATTEYTYEKAVANLGNQGSYEYYRIKTREEKSDSISYNKLMYTYDNNFSGFPAYSDSEALPADFRYTMTATDLNNKSTTMTYNYRMLLEKTEIKQQSGNKIQDIVYVYNADRLPTSIATTNYNIGTTVAATKTESYLYDAWGGVTSYTDPLNHTATFTYENSDLHRLLSETKNMNAQTMQQTQFVYVSDTVEQVKSRHFENGVDKTIVTTYTYDPANHNVLSKKTMMQDGSVVAINYEYGSAYDAGYLTRSYQSVKNIDGVTETLEQKFTYNFNTGAILTSTGQNTTEYQYDDLGRLTFIINPVTDGNSTIRTKKN